MTKGGSGESIPVGRAENWGGTDEGNGKTALKTGLLSRRSEKATEDESTGPLRRDHSQKGRI